MYMKSSGLAAGLFAILLSSSSAIAQGGLPPPEATDPLTLGTMAGFPPLPEKRVVLGNVLQYPNARWAYHHMRELAPSKQVHRGAEAPTTLEEALVDLDAVRFDDGNGGETSIADWQRSTYTDALLVLHRGKIVYENYYVGMRPREPHSLWSLSKSIVGLLTTLLIEDGTIDGEATLAHYVPDLGGTAWGNATVQQTLDMTTAADYTEDFRDPKSGIFQYLFAANLIPPPADYPGPRTLYDHLVTVRGNGQHGAAFAYKTVDTEALGWVLRRASGKSLTALVEERIWSRIGAESNAYYLVDPIGTEIASVGFNATLRDLARFGEVLRNNGRHNGEQVIPAGVLAEIRGGADREKFKAAGQEARAGYSYHNQWWIPHDADGTFEAKGLGGQQLHVNPAAELVIVKFSSHPVGETVFTHRIDRAAFIGIAAALAR